MRLIGVDAPVIVGARTADIFDGFDVEGFHAQSVRAWNIGGGGCDGTGYCGVGRVSDRHGDVDVLEDLAGSDAENAVEGLDEVVALAATMLASEMIGEAERGAELLGFDEEASAIRFPFDGFHGARPERC